jgi:two-component system phosphate regulon sensor histidine kinase PhoR
MKKKRKLLWLLYPSYLAIIIPALAAVAWYATSSLQTFYLEKSRADLRARAIVLAALARNGLSPEDWGRLDALAKKLGSRTSTRITVMLASGKVIADSASDPSAMTDHSDRPEVRAALQGKVGHSTRHSYTLQRDMMYVAVPLRQNGRVVGVVRTSTPVTIMAQTLRAIYLKIAGAGLIVALLAAMLSFLISRRLAGTIEEMKQGAERFASGDLLYRLGGGPSEEMSGLAEAMNRMAEQLHERLLTITRQRNELEAMLTGMVEAVIVFDTEEHIIRMNRAAEKLFQVSVEQVRGRALQEAIRNSDLQRFVKRTLAGGGPEEGDLAVPGEPSRFIQAHGSIVRNGQDRLIGAVVVLNDVTRLKTLETIRKDFVANVSHELRTPVTTIKGFLETLREGAINDPENSERFMNIAIKHTDRLSMIIEDLLSLSRIEEESEKGKILLKPGAIGEVIQAVKRECQDAAADKNITLQSECDDTAAARINPTLFEQALVNLVDNAVKYSEPGKTVQINASRSNGEVVVEVRDQGCGIAEEHLPRIFERFYCVDKGRSREIGGTGLGLAIVKHIVIAHGGKITVESTPGRGTNFCIHLPEA